jgi:hypothetical protein
VLARRRLAGLRPWLLAHPVDLVIAEVDPGAALAAAAAEVPCVLHSFGSGPGRARRFGRTSPARSSRSHARRAYRSSRVTAAGTPTSISAAVVAVRAGGRRAIRVGAVTHGVESAGTVLAPARTGASVDLSHALPVFGNATLLRAAAAALALLPVDVLLASGSVARASSPTCAATVRGPSAGRGAARGSSTSLVVDVRPSAGPARAPARRSNRGAVATRQGSAYPQITAGQRLSPGSGTPHDQRGQRHRGTDPARGPTV